MVVRSPTLQNVALDLAAACRRLVAHRRYRAFLDFARSIILRESDWLLTGLNAYRGVLRTVGIHKALWRRSRIPGAVLVDEGTVQSAHSVLVHVGQPARAHDIRAFRKLVPLPDLIIHVTAPIEVVLARTLARRDPPMRHRNRDDNLRFVLHAHAMFDELMADAAFPRERVTIHCRDDGWDQYRNHAAVVVERIARASAAA